MTFSSPVEIPGVHLKGFRTLPAGTYVFKLMDSTVNRHIVQIQSADEKKTFATILAIPNTRVKRTDDTVITFRERPNGEPPALRAWFYPTDAWGEEFVYGKSEAKTLAASNNTPVLYGNDQNQDADIDDSKAPTTDQVMAANPAGDEVNMDQAVTPPDNNTTAQNTNTAPAGNDTPVADNTPAPAPAPQQVADATPPASNYSAPAPAPSAEPATLPQTASPVGLMLLTGLFALGGAIGVRLVRA